MIRKLKRRQFIGVRIPDIKRVRFRNNHPVTSIQYILRHPVMPGLNDPVPIKDDSFPWVSQCVIPYDPRFAGAEIPEPVQEGLEELVVVVGVPDIGHLVGTEVVQWGELEILVDCGY